MFPTNPINGSESSRPLRTASAPSRLFPTNPINGSESSSPVLQVLAPARDGGVSCFQQIRLMDRNPDQGSRVLSAPWHAACFQQIRLMDRNPEVVLPLVNECAKDAFPTNPINGSESSPTTATKVYSSWLMFPTNPINGSESS